MTKRLLWKLAETWKRRPHHDFSHVSRKVDENGMALIIKDNKPRYVVVDFAEYDEIKRICKDREMLISDTADSLIAENLEALRELAK